MKIKPKHIRVDGQRVSHAGLRPLVVKAGLDWTKFITEGIDAADLRAAMPQFSAVIADAEKRAES